MRVFVAYGFRESDRWIREHVIPLIRAFGAEVVTGENVGGQQITNAVRDRIRSSDALIGFVTARDAAGTVDETHAWVLQELAIALELELKVLEVRQVGLSNQPGIFGDRQHLNYVPADEAGCLVGLAGVLGEWSRGMTMRVVLLPTDIAQRVRPLMRRNGFRCTYTIAENGREQEVPASLILRPGGLELRASGVPPSGMISVRVEGGGATYTSPFVDADALAVTLELEP